MYPQFRISLTGMEEQELKEKTGFSAGHKFTGGVIHNPILKIPPKKEWFITYVLSDELSRVTVIYFRNTDIRTYDISRFIDRDNPSLAHIMYDVVNENAIDEVIEVDFYFDTGIARIRYHFENIVYFYKINMSLELQNALHYYK